MPVFSEVAAKGRMGFFRYKIVIGANKKQIVHFDKQCGHGEFDFGDEPNSLNKACFPNVQMFRRYGFLECFLSPCLFRFGTNYPFLEEKPSSNNILSIHFNPKTERYVHCKSN